MFSVKNGGQSGIENSKRHWKVQDTLADGMWMFHPICIW